MRRYSSYTKRVRLGFTPLFPFLTLFILLMILQSTITGATTIGLNIDEQYRNLGVMRVGETYKGSVILEVGGLGEMGYVKFYTSEDYVTLTIKDGWYQNNNLYEFKYILDIPSYLEAGEYEFEIKGMILNVFGEYKENINIAVARTVKFTIENENKCDKECSRLKDKIQYLKKKINEYLTLLKRLNNRLADYEYRLEEGIK